MLRGTQRQVVEEKVRDIEVQISNMDPDMIENIERAFTEEKMSLSDIVEKFDISLFMASQIVNYQRHAKKVFQTYMSKKYGKRKGNGLQEKS